MTFQRDYVVYIDDMLDAISNGVGFIKGISFREFNKDFKTQYALIRAIEIVGEASKKIPREIKTQYSKIPWREISGMRDKLIHDYFGVNKEVVWKTAKDDFPALRVLLKRMKKELN